MANGTDSFYGSIAVFRGFASLMDPALYSPLPDDWTIGIADIVESTRAIANQRYKAVNMAGASVIAAVPNALEGREFPFVFGGDGASFAVGPDDFDRARGALARSVRRSLDADRQRLTRSVERLRARPRMALEREGQRLEHTRREEAQRQEDHGGTGGAGQNRGVMAIRDSDQDGDACEYESGRACRRRLDCARHKGLVKVLISLAFSHPANFPRR